ncbi:MAG TPA: DNA-3-methyladenine glycosylase [Rhodospirillaceae bacterium]|nr:DNA-3-methyladenine glycosylase [Rhodospirillaceae bacterium]
MENKKLSRAFFERPTLEVARDLLGKTLVFGRHSGIITETEAYIGENDPACHAARGRTKRTETMYAKAGTVYIYLIYGMYHCLNIVTEAKDFPAAVLIRGLRMEGQHLDGPGKLCKALGLTRQHNGLDAITSGDICILDTPTTHGHITTPRIGIRQGTDLHWRFVLQDTSGNSSPRKKAGPVSASALATRKASRSS